MCNRAWLHPALDACAQNLQCRLSRRGISSDRVGWRLTHERRLHKGWLDERHANPERSYHLAQGLAEPLKCEFAGGVHAQIRGSNLADHRADIDDAPTALLAHHRQHGLDHADDTEQVGIELGLHIDKTALLNRADLGI